MLTMGGGVPVAFNKFCRAMNPPKLVCVSAQAASMMVALGAPALAHSTSTAASESAPLTPGSAQLLGPLPAGCTCSRDPSGYADESPKPERKVFQSAVE